MQYLTFKGKSRQEAYAALKAEQKNNPRLKEARIIKDSVDTVSSFMGFRQETVYQIIVGVPDYFSPTALPTPEKLKKERESFPKFSAIEKAVINKKSEINTLTENTLFAIKGATKVAEQISRLELPQKEKEKLAKTPSLKELELKKELSSLRSEFKEIKNILTSQQKNLNHSQLIDTLQESRELPNELEIYQQHIRWIEKYLNTREFSPALIEDIISYLETTPEMLTNKKTILQEVEIFLKNHIPMTDVSLDHYQYGDKIILVGATGVGKTSTIVKLAAHLSLMRKKSFRFISIDKYKVGGETQLEKLASYMNTQFHPINQQEEFFKLLSEDTHDFTFIDTAGKGPKETIAIQELSHWLSAVGKPIDVHLVVSATTKVSDLEYICDTYGILNYSHLLVTKLDETKTLGSIISLAYRYQKPLSFATDGQEIPQDFEIADTHRLIRESLI